MHGVENHLKMQLLLGLKGSPLVGGTINQFCTTLIMNSGAALQVKNFLGNKDVRTINMLGDAKVRAGGKDEVVLVCYRRMFWLIKNIEKVRKVTL